MRIYSYALTDVGQKRDHNEDSHLLRPELSLYAVADGMGGHQAGERASRLALDGLSSALQLPTGKLARDELRDLHRRAAQAAGNGVFTAAMSDPNLEGMGTTLTSLWLHDGRAYLAHVGDSRAYLYRDGQVRQLTNDHSWVSEQVRAGTMTEDEAKESRFRHIITRSVGFEEAVEVDTDSLSVQAGDCFLLCSDGLSNYMELDDLSHAFGHRYYKDVPKTLVDLANERGGDDNITVVVVYIANEPA